MTGTDVVSWPSVRDVVRDLGVSQTYVSQLIRAKPPRLRAVRTRLGWLVDPASVAAFRAERERRQRERSA
jgi:hypothetical protein